MDYAKINEVIQDLNIYNLKRRYNVVAESEDSNYERETNEGEQGRNEIVFNLGFDNLFLKVVETTDSYGDTQGISSVQFVRPQVKTVELYEPIK